jgi:hypothetical protein
LKQYTTRRKVEKTTTEREESGVIDGAGQVSSSNGTSLTEITIGQRRESGVLDGAVKFSSSNGTSFAEMQRRVHKANIAESMALTAL